jgi:hypothetical protein
MKTLYVYTSSGSNPFLREEKFPEGNLYGYTLIGTLEIQEPVKEKKWVKKEFYPDCSGQCIVHELPRSGRIKGAVISYEVEE